MIPQISITPYILAGLLALNINSLTLPGVTNQILKTPQNNEEVLKMQQPKFVGENFARKWYDIGAQYKDSDLSLRNAILDAYEKGIGDVDCWEKCSAFQAGKNGLPFEIKTWERFGPVPMGKDGYAERSRNHADNEVEDGVSAIDQEWLSSFRGMLSNARRTREIVTFTGIQVGHGSDGEPVVLPVAVK